jgi:hypothetical protein
MIHAENIIFVKKGTTEMFGFLKGYRTKLVSISAIVTGIVLIVDGKIPEGIVTIQGALAAWFIHDK